MRGRVDPVVEGAAVRQHDVHHVVGDAVMEARRQQLHLLLLAAREPPGVALAAQVLRRVGCGAVQLFHAAQPLTPEAAAVGARRQAGDGGGGDALRVAAACIIDVAAAGFVVVGVAADEVHVLGAHLLPGLAADGVAGLGEQGSGCLRRAAAG